MRRLSRPEACVSDLELDEWSSDELDDGARLRVEQHVASCPSCQARHQAYERERSAFYAAAPSFDAHASRWVPSARPARYRTAIAVCGGALALAAAMAIAFIPGAKPGLRDKGGPHVGYFVKHGEQVTLGDSATTLRAGDLIRFTYSSEQPSYLALFDRDVRSASVYFPSGPRATRVRAGREIALDFSVQLDDAQGVEQVFALFCSESFELEPLRVALLTSGQLPVPHGCQLDSVTLRKAPAP